MDGRHDFVYVKGYADITIKASLKALAGVIGRGAGTQVLFPTPNR